ncbi:MAG: hypothetical protein KY453_09880, partial [Gemmatimonadetes bacterium]|nr:hypothetical protein [Gemmatimonadota bacterium]
LGLLLERVAGWRLPGALLLPGGLATVVALSRLITESSALAPFALPVLAVLALAGFALGLARLRAARVDRPLALAAVGVLAVFGAPVILSGSPTLAGSTVLPDTSHQLTFAWLYAQQGPDWQSLPAGTAALSAMNYITTAYPVGGQTALGVTAPLGIIDLAWLYQPFLTVLAVAGALAIAALIEPWVRGARVRALIAFVAIIFLLNGILLWLSGLFGAAVTMQLILGYLLAPLVILMGVPWSDATAVGQLIGIKIVLNEFVAYLQLSQVLGQGTPLSPRSVVIATYALAGFANFSSIAIQIGGIGGIAPSRRHDLSRLGLRAMIAGTIAAFTTATVAGMLV